MASLVYLDGLGLDSPNVAITAAQVETWYNDGYRNIILNVLHDTFSQDYSIALTGHLKVGLFQGYYPPAYSDETGAQRAQSAISAAQSVGYLQQAHIFLDVEDVPSSITEAEMITWINSWCSAVNEAGFGAGVYFGVPQPVSASDAYTDTNPGVLFWKSCSTSSITPEPCGCCILQTACDSDWDVDQCGADNLSRYAFGVSA